MGDYNRIDDLYGDGRELSLIEVCKVASLQEYRDVHDWIWKEY